jgi:predicted RNase H-like HicB family nuclease/predicted RNA binding protein YcfA (HicA-like mRNA interferase family)
MKLTIRVVQEHDDTWTAAIPELPGVFAARERPQEAIELVSVLALRVVADRVEHNEAGAILENDFELTMALRGATRSALRSAKVLARSHAAVVDRVSPEGLEQVSERVDVPVSNRIRPVRNAILERVRARAADSGGANPRWRTVAARVVRAALERAGWHEKRKSASYATLSKAGIDFVFPFAEHDLVRPQLLNQIAAATGLTADDLQSQR